MKKSYLEYEEYQVTGMKPAASWDRPLPPVPKLSPYAKPQLFVPTRMMNPDDYANAQFQPLTRIQPLHRINEPPCSQKQPKRIRDSRKKNRQTLMYLATNGDCVTMFPNTELSAQLGDSYVDKSEENEEEDNEENNEENEEADTMKPTTAIQRTAAPLPKINYSAELAWIAREAKSLYIPHGIPEQISKLKPLIKYTDGLNLRTICEHIRNQHWMLLSNKKLEFREAAWGKMHAERIPAGRLRDSFVYAFVTYLPYLSHLPILHTQNSNPY